MNIKIKNIERTITEPGVSLELSKVEANFLLEHWGNTSYLERKEHVTDGKRELTGEEDIFNRDFYQELRQKMLDNALSNG